MQYSLPCQVDAPSTTTHAELESLSTEFEDCETAVAKEAVILKTCDISVSCLDVVSVSPTAGKVLQHCKRKLELFRSRLGGSVCVFKIGYTTNPIRRFASYRHANFSKMNVLHCTGNKGSAEMLEAALIDRHSNILGCRNEQPGGEGPGQLNSNASHFYVYVVGARADLGIPIGG